MKTTMSAVLVLFFSLTSLALNNKLALVPNETLTAIYKGVTEDDKFKFVDAKGAAVIFDATGEEVETDLYDEALVGKKFTITWQNFTEDEYDDEGEPTGKKITIKTIVSIQAAK